MTAHRPSGPDGMQTHDGGYLAFQPRIRRGAFFDASWRHGCRRFSVYNRTYITGGFTDPVAEYWQVVEKVALWPVMGERQVEVSGPDAARFVQYLTPRDMAACAVDQCKYALITDAAGGILSDPIILRRAEDRFWLSTCDCDLELWAKGVAVHAGMDVTIHDAGVSVLQVQGPQSPSVMCALFGVDVLDLRYYWSMRVPFQGTELVISRTGWSGEFGYEIYLSDSALGDALFDAILDAGQPFGIAPGGVSQIRRIEAGILSWGADITAAETPYDVGLGRLVALDAPIEFIGRAALERLASQPPTRKTVGLIVDGPPLPPNETAMALSVNGAPAGRLTSLRYSPRLDANIALGLVAAAHGDTGGTLDVQTVHGQRAATVTKLPFLAKRQQGKANA